VRGEQTVILLRKLASERVAGAKEHLLLDRSCPDFKDGFKPQDNSAQKSVACAVNNALIRNINSAE